MTWTVVTSILFVVATVLAIFATVDRNKMYSEMQTMQSRYDKVVSEADLNGDVVNALAAQKQANPTAYPGDPKLLNVALMQRDALAKKIANASNEADAMRAADTVLKQIQSDASLKAPTDSLVSAMNGLLNIAQSRENEIKQLTDARDDMSKKLAGVNAAFTAQLGAKQQDVTTAQANAQKALDDVEASRTDKDKQIADMQSKMDEQAKLAQDTVNQLTAQRQEALNRAKKSEDQIKALQSKLRDIRQPVDQILRQADAHIMRSAGDNLVYIDLGTGDQVVPGMTFEVYDRIQGIPKPGDPTNDENLPKGKASIEVIKVSPGNSECRIVRQTPGENVVEGDPCVNLVYDRNVKYNVMVYGNFDLDRNGQATPQDADVIKRLVTRWGGKVVNTLTPDTDFLVIGKVPEIPNYTQEELDRPEIQFEVERRKKELADYDDTLAKAIELNIPVLNQNRFLYFTGYYEQSAR
ncbi:MAG: BRCT domain-containing protein [Tepidisphaeraceae bacterium]